MEFQLGTILVVFVSFWLFMIAMRALYFEPMFRIKTVREQKISGDHDAAKEHLRDLDQLSHQYDAGLREARQRAQQAIQDRRAEARSEADKVLQAARQKAQAELASRMSEIAHWRESTYQELQGERDALVKTILHKVTDGKLALSLK